MRKRIFLLAALLPMAAFGQQNNNSGGSAEPIYPVIQFSVFLWSEGGILMQDSNITGIPRTFYTAPNGSPSIVRLYKNRSTPLLSYQGPQPLVLYDIQKVWTAPPEGSPPGTQPRVTENRIPKIKANIPEGLTRTMLVAFPDRRLTDGTMQTLVLPYETEKVKPGMTRILNGTDRILAVKFADNEDKVLKLKPQKALDFTPKDMTESDNPRIFIYGLDHKQRPRLLHTNRIHFKENTTNYFIVFPEGARRVRIKSLGSHENQETSPIPLP